MRPVRVTGITGNSPPVPLDVYDTSAATVILASAGAPALQITYDNIFDSTLTINWIAAPTPGPNVTSLMPLGTRAVRGTGMVPADVLTVSQQGLR
jgi:hypothetical protein